MPPTQQPLATNSTAGTDPAVRLRGLTKTFGPKVAVNNLDLSIPQGSVYGFIDRLALPGLLRTFDFPSPDSSAAQRDNTTVAPQALFLMNGPLVGEVARLLVNRPAITGVPPGPERVAALVRLLFARPPTAAEQELVDRFFGEDPAARNDPAAWQTLAEGLLLRNEFVFTD